MTAAVISLFLQLSFLAALTAAFPADRVSSLPYLTQTPEFDHYSGYLSLGTKHFHYWFVESQGNPQTDPLVLWVNGGPGCSSHYGLIFENGPFEFCDRSSESLDLCLNEFSWNKIANVVYLESPIGVGYSWSPNSNDYRTNDTQTAIDNYAVLQEFFAKFPEYQGRDFYISGESYAGIYIPTLAEEIRLGNQRGENFINLQGFLVGNGVTDPESDSTINSLAPFSFGHGLISQDTNNKIKECNGGATPNAPQCVAGLAELGQALVDVNRYQIYDKCYYGRNKDSIPWHSLKWGEEIMSDIPCINTDQASVYFNLAEVREALHVEDIQWEICSNTLRYTKNLGSDSYQFYPTLLENYRVVAFAGDTDAAVPHVGMELWTRKLGRRQLDPWRQWRVNDQVAGYVVTYDRLWYVTYKGGTHTVPESHPEESLYMLAQFFKNEPL